MRTLRRTALCVDEADVCAHSMHAWLTEFSGTAGPGSSHDLMVPRWRVWHHLCVRGPGAVRGHVAAIQMISEIALPACSGTRERRRRAARPDIEA